MVTRIRAIRRACLKEHARGSASRRMTIRWAVRSHDSFVIVPNFLASLGLRRAATPAKLDLRRATGAWIDRLPGVV